MKLKFLNTAVAGLILSLSCLVSTANATLILEDSTDINASGKTHSVTFDVTGFENYTNLVFTVNARGDFGTTEAANESIKFYIGDMSFGEFYTDTGGVTSTVGPTGWESFDIIMDFSFSVSDVFWNSVFDNNSQVNIQWENSTDVSAYSGFYVNYSLSGTPGQPSVVEPIPEPTTLAVFALAMIGLASRRFKKQS